MTTSLLPFFFAISGGLIALLILLAIGASIGGYFLWQRHLEAREKAEWEAMPVRKLDEVAPPAPSRNMEFPDIEPDRGNQG